MTAQLPTEVNRAPYLCRLAAPTPVTLTIGSADGRSDSTNQQVTVSAPLVAGFSAQPNGLDVQFTNQSSGDVTASRGTSATARPPTRSARCTLTPAGGTYTVTLTVGSADGRSNSTNQQVTVSRSAGRGLQRAAQRA